MEFQTFNELHNKFIKGDLTELPEQVVINGVTYRMREGTQLEMTDLALGKIRAVVVYNLSSDARTQARFKELHYKAESDVQDRLLFVWVARQLSILPAEVASVAKQRLIGWVNRPISQTKPSIREGIEDQRDVIGDSEKVQLVGFNGNNAIDARIDTGAGQCSLHAEQIKASDEQVEFTFEGKRYRMNLTGSQGVSSSDGGNESRPVVTFNVKVGGKLFEGISFNLNDRGNMPHKMLIGQNLLEQGKFLVDPSKDADESKNEGFVSELAMCEAYANDMDIDEEAVERRWMLESVSSGALGSLTLAEIISKR